MTLKTYIFNILVKELGIEKKKIIIIEKERFTTLSSG